MKQTDYTPIQRLRFLIAAMRPSQWTKNTILFAAFIFAYGDKTIDIDWLHGTLLIPAFLLFSFSASAIYLFNDILDRKNDRQHPTKKDRPIAAGKLSTRFAGILATGLILVSTPLAYALAPGFGSILLVYLLLQLIYCTVLKRVALLDIFIIASGFVLRAIAGAALLAIPISPWLLVCTFLLALFLALCKRRHEKASIESTAGARQRIALQKYDLLLTDQLIAIVASATVVSYAIYTLWPDTIEKFGSYYLAYTIPLVLFGIFRYLDLLYRENKGDRPEHVLLTDIPIIVTIITYGLVVLSLFTIMR